MAVAAAPAAPRRPLPPDPELDALLRNRPSQSLDTHLNEWGSLETPNDTPHANASVQTRYAQANWAAASLMAACILATICACPPAAIVFASLALAVWTFSTLYYCYHQKGTLTGIELFKEVGIQTLKAGFGFVTAPIAIYRLFRGQETDTALRTKLGEWIAPTATAATAETKQAESYYSKAGWLVVGLLCASIAAAIFACPPIAITLAILALITFTISTVSYCVYLRNDADKRPNLWKDVALQFIKCVVAPIALPLGIYQSFDAEKGDQFLKSGK